MKPAAMSSAWAEVFTGPPWKVQLLSADLEQCGIPTFTPDVNIQGIDPFIRTGGQVFDLHLLVPRDRVEEALAVVAEAQQINGEPADSSTTPADAELVRVERIAHRIQWAAGQEILAPYGLWLAMSYFPAVKKLGLRPRGHGYTTFTTVICAFWVLMMIAVYFIARFAASRGIE
jgi:hypothetical protein